EKGTYFIAIKMPWLKTSEDIAVSQLEKTREKLRNNLLKNEFKIHRADILTDKKSYVTLLFELEVWQLPKYQLHQGPPLTVTKNQETFLQKHLKLGRSVWIEGDKWAAEKKRKHPDALKLIKSEVTLARKGQLPLPSHVKQAMKKAKVLDKEGLIQDYKTNPAFKTSLTDYLFKKERFLEVEE
ncbi:MAG: hypothetical protein GOV15_04850, partial [Candidatus Diapherotrites archaeon]|nr:hypothetical protein [Candidatus Diapherotrites archaeon]